MHVADMRPAGDISLEIVSRPLLVAPTLQHTPFTELTMIFLFYFQMGLRRVLRTL